MKRNVQLISSWWSHLWDIKDWTTEEVVPPSDVIRQFLFSKWPRNLIYKLSWTWRDDQMTSWDLHQFTGRTVEAKSHQSCRLQPSNQPRFHGNFTTVTAVERTAWFYWSKHHHWQRAKENIGQKDEVLFMVTLIIQLEELDETIHKTVKYWLIQN